MATAVFVHGAWHGPWCWERVTAQVPGSVAVDLPRDDVAGDAAAVRAVLDGIDGPVLLVGHSYGGVVITEAGDHPAVAHLLYVTAFQIDETETLAAAATEEGAHIDHEGRPDLTEVLSFAGDRVTIVPEKAAEVFYNRCTADDATWARRQLRDQGLATLGSSPTTVAWRTKPSTYAVCTDDNAIHPELQRIFARRAGAAVEWDTDHSPFLSTPDLVADLVNDLLARL